MAVKFRAQTKVRLIDESRLPAELRGRTAIVLIARRYDCDVGFPGTSWAPPTYSFVEQHTNLERIP